MHIRVTSFFSSESDCLFCITLPFRARQQPPHVLQIHGSRGAEKTHAEGWKALRLQLVSSSALTPQIKANYSVVWLVCIFAFFIHASYNNTTTPAHKYTVSHLWMQHTPLMCAITQYAVLSSATKRLVWTRSQAFCAVTGLQRMTQYCSFITVQENELLVVDVARKWPGNEATACVVL